jgi:hypothetical protein
MMILSEEQREAIRKAQREHMREWRRKNPEKQKEYMARYWLKKAESAQEVKQNEQKTE